MKKTGRPGHRRRLKGERGRGTLVQEKPSRVGMIPSTGPLALRRLADGKQTTIPPLIRGTIAKDTIVATDQG